MRARARRNDVISVAPILVRLSRILQHWIVNVSQEAVSLASHNYTYTYSSRARSGCEGVATRD